MTTPARINPEGQSGFDLRDEIFRCVAGRKVIARIISDDEGVIAETRAASEEACRLGLQVHSVLDEGSRVRRGDEVMRLKGSPKQVAQAEEVLLGIISKPSGIATAVSGFIEKAGVRPRIVCGAWKKMPPPLKDAVRRAVTTGGGAFRITGMPFVYLDKNIIEMVGGIEASLSAASGLTGHVKAVQIKGRYRDIADEASEAARCGASIVFIDTGQPGDVGKVTERLKSLGLRSRVEVAFGGNVTLSDIDGLKSLDIDIVDVGRAIVDAPLLDLRMEIEAVEEDDREGTRCNASGIS